MDRLVARIFHDYYVRNFSQTRIAEHCSISRQRVQRILADERYRGMVEVRIKLPESIHTTLESELENKYGIDEMVVVDTRHIKGSEPFDGELGEATADYLLRVMDDDAAIAITWSKVLLEMTGALARSMSASYRKYKNVKIVQSLGALGEINLKFHSLEIAQRLGRIFDAKMYLLLAPVVAATPEALRQFKRESTIVETLDAFRNATIFLCGVGSMKHGESSMLRSGAITPEIERELRQGGAVGDINALFFDDFGNHVRSSLDDRLLGPNFEEMRATKRLVAVAGGPRKYKAMLGVARGGLAKVIISDYETARKLVREKK